MLELILIAALYGLPLVPLYERYKPYGLEVNRLALVMTLCWPLVESLATVMRLVSLAKGD